MPSLRATTAGTTTAGTPTAGTTTASGSFFSAIGARKLAMPVGGAAIVECNRAGSETRQTARRPHDYSGPFASDPMWCRGHPMSVLLPKGGMPRVAAECAIVWPIKFGECPLSAKSLNRLDNAKLEKRPVKSCINCISWSLCVSQRGHVRPVGRQLKPPDRQLE